MLNLVLFGPPGAGKGTQAAKLAEKYGFIHISTGEMIRNEIEQGTELGNSVRGYIENGNLAPDDLVISIIIDFLEKHKNSKGIIFDGFPRTTVQAREFDRMLSRHGMDVGAMLSLDVADDILVDRILKRGKESGRADDASEEVIRNRIKVYNDQTAVVADFYSEQGKFRPVDGAGSIEHTFEQLCKEVDKLA